MKCKNNSCFQKPELKQTGFGPPHPEWVCDSCKCKYFPDEKDGIAIDNPYEKKLGGIREVEKKYKKDFGIIWQAPRREEEEKGG